MGTITVKVSDLSGQQIEGEGARLVVEHPDFPEPIGLDVVPEEVEPHLSGAETRFVVVSYQTGEGADPKRYVLPQEAFNDLFLEVDSTTVLEQALLMQREERERTRGRRGRGATGETRRRVDYTTPEYAGEPHRGRIRDKEKEYVQTHLDEVNARLREKGMRQIDPTDPQMVERYGLRAEPIVETREPVEEAEVVEEEPPRG